MYKSVIAGYSRSPFTMARKGALVDTKPVDLLADVIKNLVSKSTDLLFNSSILSTSLFLIPI